MWPPEHSQTSGISRPQGRCGALSPMCTNSAKDYATGPLKHAVSTRAALLLGRPAAAVTAQLVAARTGVTDLRNADPQKFVGRRLLSPDDVAELVERIDVEVVEPRGASATPFR